MSGTEAEAGPSKPRFSFESLLETIADPSSSDLDLEELRTSLGINGIPTPAQARQELEDELLSPARDLIGPDLWRWQL